MVFWSYGIVVRSFWNLGFGIYSRRRNTIHVFSFDYKTKYRHIRRPKY